MPTIPPAVLASLGLSELEAKVYLATLELGEAPMQTLSRKSGVKRTSIYNFLDKLKEQKLITETRKGKRSVYTAANPQRLSDMAAHNLEEYQRLLPELLAVHNRSSSKPKVKFYEGIEGIKEVYEDTLRERKPIVAWSDFEQMQAALGAYFEQYPKERASRGITFKTIARDSQQAREIAKHDIDVLRKQKYLRSGDPKTEINVYGDKVALMSFRGSSPLAVLIEDRDIAETLRVVWNQLWELL